jgi:hypothetical protein
MATACTVASAPRFESFSLDQHKNPTRYGRLGSLPYWVVHNPCFDPSRICMVHDRLNYTWNRWDPPKDETLYRAWAEPQDSQTPDVIQYDGRVLDGWAQE